MLWVDKHRPSSLDSLSLHEELTEKLKILSTAPNFPHLLFFGPSGSGKKTRISALLRALYGPGAAKTRAEHKSFKLPNRSEKLEILTLSSAFHIEMTPSDAGIYDRVVVQDVIKEIASSKPLPASAFVSGSMGGDNGPVSTFKVVVLHEADSLSSDAQHALRRTLEKYSSTCRVILNANSLTRMAPPLISRCLSLRVGAPSHDQVVEVLRGVVAKEGLKSVPEPVLEHVAKMSRRNVRRALLCLEAGKARSYPFTAEDLSPFELPDWEVYVYNVAKQIVSDQSPARLMQIRAAYYELLGHAIPPSVLLRRLTQELLVSLDASLAPEIARWAAHYEFQMVRGTKPILHLEAFTAKAMSLYKAYLNSMMGDF